MGEGHVVVVVVVVEDRLTHIVLGRIALLLVMHRHRYLVEEVGQAILGGARGSLVARRLVEARLCICIPMYMHTYVYAIPMYMQYLAWRPAEAHLKHS